MGDPNVPPHARLSALEMKVAAIERRIGPCATCGGTGLVPNGLPSNGPEPCPECGPDEPEHKVIDLMHALEDSLDRAKTAAAIPPEATT